MLFQMSSILSKKIYQKKRASADAGAQGSNDIRINPSAGELGD